MNILLILREEIVCFIVLSFLFFYSHIYSKGEQKRFIRACAYAIGHVIFDIITVITVNNDVHPTINWICHIIFYYFALLFCYELFKYCLSIVMKVDKKLKHFLYKTLIFNFKQASKVNDISNFFILQYYLSYT